MLQERYSYLPQPTKQEWSNAAQNIRFQSHCPEVWLIAAHHQVLSLVAFGFPVHLHFYVQGFPLMSSPMNPDDHELLIAAIDKEGPLPASIWDLQPCPLFPCANLSVFYQVLFILRFPSQLISIVPPQLPCSMLSLWTLISFNHLWFSFIKIEPFFLLPQILSSPVLTYWADWIHL